MWPFKKRQLDRDWDAALSAALSAALAEERARAVEPIEKLKAFRDVGETFNYLGRTCVVTGHYDWWPYVGAVPALKFDYCDDYGKLHSAVASVSELPALENQQKPNTGVGRFGDREERS